MSEKREREERERKGEGDMAVHVTQVMMMKPIVQALGNHAVKNGLRCGVSSSAAAAAAGAAAASSLPLTKPDATEESSSLLTSPLAVPPRLLMGPGPSNTHPRALAAMALPQLGHMHAPFLKIMDEIKAGLQYLLQVCVMCVGFPLAFFSERERACENVKCAEEEEEDDNE